MARLIWTEPALDDLDVIAEYISLDNPDAARRLVDDVLASAERLEAYPRSGKRVKELPRSPYREIVVPPCRVFYRPETNAVFILHVMRGEQLFRKFLLRERDRKK
jgi:toxin ParE1/3/4